MIKLYRRLRKWIVLHFFWRKLTYCRDCMWEARADIGVYSSNEDISESQHKKAEEMYKHEYYFAHMDPWGYRSKVVVR